MNRLLVASALSATVLLAQRAQVSGTAHYIYPHFTDTDQTHLRIDTSEDGHTWTRNDPVCGAFYQLRDPSIVQEGGTSYFVYSNGTPTSVGFFSTADLDECPNVRAIDLAPWIPGITSAWAPEFYKDPVSGALGFFVSVPFSPLVLWTTTPMYPYFVRIDLAGNVESVERVILSGTTNARTFDYYPVLRNGKYFLYYVDQQPTLDGSIVQPLAVAVSDRIDGPYQQISPKGSDYFGFGTFSTEAPTVFEAHDGSRCQILMVDTFTPDPNDNKVWGYKYHQLQRRLCNGVPSGPVTVPDVVAEHGSVISIDSSFNGLSKRRSGK